VAFDQASSARGDPPGPPASVATVSTAGHPCTHCHETTRPTCSGTWTRRRGALAYDVAIASIWKVGRASRGVTLCLGHRAMTRLAPRSSVSAIVGRGISPLPLLNQAAIGVIDGTPLQHDDAPYVSTDQLPSPSRSGARSPPRSLNSHSGFCWPAPTTQAASPGRGEGWPTATWPSSPWPARSARRGRRESDRHPGDQRGAPDAGLSSSVKSCLAVMATSVGAEDDESDHLHQACPTGIEASHSPGLLASGQFKTVGVQFCVNGPSKRLPWRSCSGCSSPSYGPSSTRMASDGGLPPTSHRAPTSQQQACGERTPYVLDCLIRSDAMRCCASSSISCRATGGAGTGGVRRGRDGRRRSWTLAPRSRRRRGRRAVRRR
jgi:hypothetical protein